MITVRHINLKPYSLGECWRMAPPLRGLDFILSKLFGWPIRLEVVAPCWQNVTLLEENLLPAKFRQTCQEVQEECEPAGLQFLFHYRYPPFLGDTDLGAAFLTTDCRTVGFLHYCEPRWPRTFFYSISRLPGETFLLTTDMEELVSFPTEFLAGFRPYYRYYPEDVLELHIAKLQKERSLLLEESQVGPLIAEVQNRFARHRQRLK